MLSNHSTLNIPMPPVSLMVLVVGLIHCGKAQDTLTLDQCIALARSNSPRIRLAENAMRSAELSLAELKSAGLPQITAVAGATYTPVPPKYAYDPAITDGGQLLGQLVVRQSLYDGGIRALRSDQQRIDLQRTGHEREIAERDLILAVKLAFAEALRAQEEVELRWESLEQLSAYGDLVHRLYGGGTANYGDVLKAEMQTSGAQLALDKAREMSGSARFSLAEFTGMLADSTIRMAGSPLELSGLSVDTANAAKSIDLRVAGLLVEKGELEVEMARHERFPLLSLVVDAGYLSSGDNLRLPRESRLRAIGYSLGVGVEIPIFNWGVTGARVEERELAVDDLGQQRELLRRSISTETRKVSLQLSRTRARYASLGEIIRKARENFLLSKAKYAVGGTLALDVLTAQQLLTDAKIEELQTRAGIRVLSARLERLTAHEEARQ